jgi:hypothetical protein
VTFTFTFNTSLRLYQNDVGLQGAQNISGHWGQEDFVLVPGDHPATSTFTLLGELCQVFVQIRWRIEEDGQF